MELRQLRHFVSLAEEMHFGLAAERACITQPSLSASIARLEAELGVVLFERDSKRVAITPAGRLLLQNAREILGQGERMASLSQALAEGRAGLLNVGITQPVLCCGVDRVVLAVRQKVPGIDVAMREEVSPIQLELLRSGKLDAAFVMLAEPPSGLKSIPLYEDRHVIWLPAGHRLAGQVVIDVGELRDEAFILPQDHNAPYLSEQVAGLCAAEGFRPRILIEARSALSALHLVARGMGISFLAASLQALGITGAICVPLRQAGPRRDAYFVWDEGRIVPGLAVLIESVRAFAAGGVPPVTRP